MVDLNIVEETRYINVELVNKSPTKKIVVIDSGRLKPFYVFGDKVDKLVLGVEIDKKNKFWIPKKEDVEELRKFGTDSKHLVGKVFLLSVVSKQDGFEYVKATAILN